MNEETNSEDVEFIQTRSKSITIKSVEAKFSQVSLQDTPKGSKTALKNILKTPSTSTMAGK